MGDMADDCEQLSYQYEEYLERLEDDLSQGRWMMRDGSKVSVKDMSHSHLENAARILRRNTSSHAARWLRVITLELELRHG